MIIDLIFDENSIADESLCTDMTRDCADAWRLSHVSSHASLASPTAHQDVMANIVRSAKSGSDWTRSDLDSYHITIHQVDHLLFFGLQVTRGSSAFVIGKT